ncbi:hypothetical protein ACIO13_36895 [Streptomyces sp. NPDC087425]
MLDTREWPGSLAEYVDRLLDLTDVSLADPTTSSARTQPVNSAD